MFYVFFPTAFFAFGRIVLITQQSIMAGDTSKRRSTCVVGGKTIAVLFIVGLLLAVAGISLFFVMDGVIQNKIDEKLVLKPGTEVSKQWQDPAVPIYMQFFMFDIANPIEAMQGERPYLVQKGPYSYREHRPKKNITWNSRTVTYNEKMSYIFDAKTSCDSCDPFTDIVTTVNIPLVTLSEAVAKSSSIERNFVSAVFAGFKETLFTPRRVHDLLWGYPDPIFEEYNKLRKDLPPFLRKKFPKINPIIALQQNNSFDGVTSVSTGESDINSLVHVKSWKGQTKLKVWNTPYANMLNGTDGSQFAPGTNPDDTLYVFVDQLCRSLYLTHDSKIEVQGIEALQFSVPAEAFQNGTLNPDNIGFCTSKCYPSGILDIGVCQPPSPVAIPLFASAPHFYLGAKSLLEAVDGLSPNKEEHETVLNVEPHTGISVKSSKRLQINVKIEHVDLISQTGNIPKMFLPVFYINETATIDKASADKLKSEVLSKFVIVHGIELGLVLLGSLLIIIAFILLILRIVHKRKLKKVREMLQINEDSERQPLLSS